MLDDHNLASLDNVSALPKRVKSPSDNPSTAAKVKLGKLLFYDPILSGDRDVACATCHHPDFGYSEFLDLSIGSTGRGLSSKRRLIDGSEIPLVKRNSQTILNTAFNGINTSQLYDPSSAIMFWDGRATSLEGQALEPIKSYEEMRGSHIAEGKMLEVAVDRLNQNEEYKRLFKAAFTGIEKITEVELAKAIASFERTLITNNSRFDEYMRGDKSAISIMEEEGLELFRKVGCVNCHNGPMFSDYKMHVLGVADNDKLGYQDKGVDSTYAFRTPSLRNLRYTAPYMHNGTLPHLERVLEFYQDLSFRKVRHEDISIDEIDPLIATLELKANEFSSIISFLNTLNDDTFDRTIPERVPSGLAVGGNIQ